MYSLNCKGRILSLGGTNCDGHIESDTGFILSQEAAFGQKIC